jgi:hypothetical protein
MKKIIAVLLSLSLMLCCFLSVSAETAQYKVGIVLLIENGAFMDMKKGIIEGLAELGYVEGTNLTIDYQCAQATPPTSRPSARIWMTVPMTSSLPSPLRPPRRLSAWRAKRPTSSAPSLPRSQPAS